MFSAKRIFESGNYFNKSIIRLILTKSNRYSYIHISNSGMIKLVSLFYLLRAWCLFSTVARLFFTEAGVFRFRNQRM